MLGSDLSSSEQPKDRLRRRSSHAADVHSDEGGDESSDCEQSLFNRPGTPQLVKKKRPRKLKYNDTTLPPPPKPGPIFEPPFARGLPLFALADETNLQPVCMHQSNYN